MSISSDGCEKIVLETILDNLKNQVARGEKPKLDILILSGGGAKGAFGSAFLRSWEANVADDHPLAFPDFDLVSDISTGALIAPYAIIGTPERLEEAENIYRKVSPDWVGFSFWSTVFRGQSIANTDKLDEKMRSHFNLELAQEIADQQNNHHQQIITSSANLDLARPIAWRIGDAAQKTINNENPEDLFLPLRASASIPGAFSPIIVDDMLHSDGAVFGQIHVMADTRLTEYILRRWRRIIPNAGKPKIRYWVIINNLLREQPTTVQPTWLSVMSRANTVTYKHLVVQPMNLLASNVRLIGEMYDMDIEMRWITIPREFEFTDVDNEFDPAYTGPLADLGAQLGADPTAWKGIDDLGVQELDQALKTPLQKKESSAVTVPATPQEAASEAKK